MSTAPSRRPRYVLHDGFRMPMGFPVEAFGSALGYRPHSGDVFVATYPKCGTTWMQYIVYLLMSGGAPLSADRRLADVFPHLEESGAEFVEAMAEPRLIKTHLSFSMLRYSEAAKYIYVARNPFDCAVSFFHHTRGFVRHYDFAEGTFDDFFECFIAGEVDFGDYFDHLIAGFRLKDESNVLFVTYERMHAAIDEVIAEVAQFLGGAAGRTMREPRLVARIREESSFSRMCLAQRRWSSARPPGMPEFVRKGEVGDWRGHFKPDQARRLAAEFARRTGKAGPYRLWPEHLAAAWWS